MATDTAAQLRAAAVKIGVAVVAATGLFALYRHELQVEAQVQDLLAGVKIAGGVRAGGARAELNKDTPRGLLQTEQSIQKALELQPSNPYGVAALADVEYQLAAFGYADRMAKGDEALARAEGKEVNLPERHEAHALQLLLQGKPGDAETYALALLQKYGSVPRLLDAAGRAQRAQGKLLDARTSFKRASDAEWRSPRFVADYGEALLDDGNGAEAAAAFDRALQANSDHLRAQLGKARALLALLRDGRAVDPKLAVSMCDSVLQHPADELPLPLKAEALAVRVEARLAGGDRDGAAKDLAEAVLSGAKQPAVLRAQAMAAAADKKPEAAQLFRDAADAAPYQASTYFDGAFALAAAGDGAGAEKLLGSYAARLPQGARFHLALGRLLADRGDVKAAAGELAKAQQLEPTNALVYYEQGRLAQRQKDQKTAAAAYEKVVQLRDDFPDVYRQMGSMYLDNKQVEQALRVFNEALVRYKAARTAPLVMEAFYSDVVAQVTKAGKKKLAAEWVKEARASH